MKTIFKYELPQWPGGTEYRMQSITAADVVHVDWQNGMPHMWIEIDLKKVEKRYYVTVFATGEAINNATGCVHIGTLLQPTHPTTYVWHYYMRELDDDERIN